MISALRTVLLAALLALLPLGAYAQPPEGKNRLIFETSPYLLLHAENPVDWYPWGEEAFTRAVVENKPIFLSVGYSTCYWCHVMEHESFSDAATAELLNRHFVSIKVDREERPDVDEIYMLALMGMTGRGGWPMSIFLTPELKPFHGGTYFPNNIFKDLLRQVQEAWTDRPEALRENADRLARALRTRAGLAEGPAPALPSATLNRKAVDHYSSVFDGVHGGFGRAPKFPRPSILELLLSHYERSRNPESLLMVTETLDAMARGGIYDQVGGGFHRYSTDARWLVPHFEKMLYDNAQLLHVYVRAYELTGEGEFRRIAEDIIGYVRREMTSPGGLFYSAQDAAVAGEEGKSYIWSADELKRALSAKEFTLAGRVYGFDSKPNFEGRYILHRPEGFAEAARREEIGEERLIEAMEKIRGKLLQARGRREQPLLDDKSITAWNGLMIEALSEAARVLKSPAHLQLVREAAKKLLASLRDGEGRFLHVSRHGEAKLEAYLDDYGAAILGLVGLSRASGEELWLTEAAELADAMIERLYDPAGGFHYAAPSVKHLLVRVKDSFDGALPAGNSLAVRALVGLAENGMPRFVPYAAATLRAYAKTIEKNPHAMPYMLWALHEYRSHGLAEDARPPRATLPVTADMVRIEGRISDATLLPGKSAELSVWLRIEKGWHVNANPASLATLIATRVAVDMEGGELDLAPAYPPGRRIAAGVEGAEIAVYDEGTVISSALRPVSLPAGKDGGVLGVSVRAQACNDTGRCLIPSTLTIDLPVRFSSGKTPPPREEAPESP